MGTGQVRHYYYDKVYDYSATQQEVYLGSAFEVVNHVMNGTNGTIITYGQTGSGKTFTMGTLTPLQDTSLGLVPLGIRQVFAFINSSPDEILWNIRISFVQVYREDIFDLLDESGGVVLVRGGGSTTGWMEGQNEVEVESEQEAFDVINMGLSRRAMAPTMMNSTSSRSHTILKVMVESMKTDPQDNEQDDPQSNSASTSSILTFVDLAGCERVERSGSSGVRLDEAKSINRSLSTLCLVVKSLGSTAQFIPFRNSKLTRVLSSSLQRGSQVVVIGTISPTWDNTNESLSTCEFCRRCGQMELKSMEVIERVVLSDVRRPISPSSAPSSGRRGSVTSRASLRSVGDDFDAEVAEEEEMITLSAEVFSSVIRQLVSLPTAKRRHIDSLFQTGGQLEAKKKVEDILCHTALYVGATIDEHKTAFDGNALATALIEELSQMGEEASKR
ncbi:putative Kinesin heavy chain [Blattamonas nauphoetae]|uniref:Kinesin heavy chain n=1 Tax=Blattamonas nauphoetae TaxID=2049346 RepID=A0ABQ9Y101_9EUKA|nr:putative Kinesin heavy chain [Blattamonas nauphoetae]